MRKRFMPVLLGGLAPLFAVVHPAAAQAQVAADDAVSTDEIVVTARKRAESIQRVPLAVTAVDAAALARLNVKTIADLKIAPNVEIVSAQLQPSGAVFYIRGVGNKAQEPFIDTPVAISVDGFYLPISTGAMLDLFDVQQVEVLRGPQGTLQGRNSPGGAVNVTSRRPSGDFGFEGELGYGRFNTYDVKLAGEAPIVPDVLAARASMMITKGDGPIRNILTGQHLGGREIYAGRLSLLFTPSADFDLFISGDYNANRSDQIGTRGANLPTAFPRQPVPVACSLLGVCAPLKPWTVDTDWNAPYHSNTGGVAATANWNLGGVTLTSVSGYRKLKERQNADVDGTSFPFIHVIGRTLDMDTWSQELRLASNKSGAATGGQLDWVFGGLIYDSKFDLEQPVAVFGTVADQFGHQTLRSYALFGQATYHITDAWSISAGARQSWDKKRYLGIQPGYPPASEVDVRARFDNFSVEASTEYRVTRDHLVYVRFAQGYRAGGINGGAASPETVTPFDPETVDSYEIGAKTEWLDRHLVVNLALFQNDYKDLQREVVLPSTAGFTTVIRNAANARIKGAELEVVMRPSDQFNVRASYGYLDAKYRSFFADILGTGVAIDNSFLRLPFTPKHSISFGADYTVPMGDGSKLMLAAQLNMKSSYTVNPTDTQVGNEDGYETVDLSARYDFMDGKLGVEAYARNLFGAHYIVAAENVGGAASYQIDGPRATYGGRLFFKF